MHLLISLKRALFAAFVCFHSKSNSLLPSVASGEDKELAHRGADLGQRVRMRVNGGAVWASE
ncbi:hypothetical protein BHU16_09485 [Tannerella sp. oral taxon 808]|nr:hypothetical protein BHU16_09485 [Tannerella sp. oral taxon 808]